MKGKSKEIQSTPEGAYRFGEFEVYPSERQLHRQNIEAFFFLFPLSPQAGLRGWAERVSKSGANSPNYQCTGTGSRFKYSSTDISFVRNKLRAWFNCRNGAVRSSGERTV